jgi:hypothetical protein
MQGEKERAREKQNNRVGRLRVQKETCAGEHKAQQRDLENRKQEKACSGLFGGKIDHDRSEKGGEGEEKKWGRRKQRELESEIGGDERGEGMKDIDG